MGEPTLSCGPLTEAAIQNGVPESSARATSRIKRPLPRQRIAWNHPGQESISKALSRGTGTTAEGILSLALS